MTTLSELIPYVRLAATVTVLLTVSVLIGAEYWAELQAVGWSEIEEVQS